MDPGVLVSASRLSHGFGGETEGFKAVIPSLHDTILHDTVSTAPICGGGAVGANAPTQSKSIPEQGMHQQQVGEGEYESDLAMLKYQRSGCTFHVKGLWCEVAKSPTEEITEGNGKAKNFEDISALSYIGSSNMGERSWNRDMELGFVLVTHNVQLRKSLRNEVARTLGHCRPVKIEDLRGLREGPIQLHKSGSARLLSSKNSMALLARLLRSYL